METKVEWGLLSLWAAMGTPAKIVVCVMMLMSVWSIWVMIERALTFRSARKESLEYVPVITNLLREHKLKNVVELSKKYKNSHISKVVSSGLQEYMLHQNPGDESEVAVIEAVKRALERAAAVTYAELKKGLGSLATIGSTAVFVGLFGTVVGIISAFQKMAEAGAGGLAVVSKGIAEALVTTAFGLFVAIPAVWAFNYFQNRIEAFNVEMSNSSSEIIDYTMKTCGGSSRGNASR